MKLVTNYLVVRAQRYCKMGRHSPDSLDMVSASRLHHRKCNSALDRRIRAAVLSFGSLLSVQADFALRP